MDLDLEESKINNNKIIDITFEPLWEHITLTRYFLESFLLLIELEQNKVGRIVLSVSELLENAIKYTDKKKIRLVISRSEDKNSVIVHVLNYANEETSKELFRLIQEMKFNDSLSFYLQQMKSPPDKRNNKSCLGLARVNHEANAVIKAQLKNNSLLHVQAIINFEGS